MQAVFREVADPAFLLADRVPLLQLGLETETEAFLADRWAVVIPPAFEDGILQQAVRAVQAEVGAEELVLGPGLRLAVQHAVAVVDAVAQHDDAPRLLDVSAAQLLGPDARGDGVHLADRIPVAFVAGLVLEGVVMAIGSREECDVALCRLREGSFGRGGQQQGCTQGR